MLTQDDHGGRVSRLRDLLESLDLLDRLAATEDILPQILKKIPVGVHSNG